MAGSVGPYGACQHDRSEYTGKYVDDMTIEVRPQRFEVALNSYTEYDLSVCVCNIIRFPADQVF